MNRRLFLKMAAALGVRDMWKPDQAATSAVRIGDVRIRYLDEPGEWYMVEHGGIFWNAEQQSDRRWSVDVSAHATQASEAGGYSMRRLIPSDRLRRLLGEQGLVTQLETEDVELFPSLVGQTEISDPLEALRILATVVDRSTPQELLLDPWPDDWGDFVVACAPAGPTIWLPGNGCDLA